MLDNTLSLVPFLAIRLILVHVIADFVLRSRILRHEKAHKLLRILTLAIIRSVLIYTAASDWSNYWILVIALCATILAELPRPRHARIYPQCAQRQFLHVIALCAIWLLSANPSAESVTGTLSAIWSNPTLWIGALGYAFVIWPAGYLTGVFTAPWRGSIQTNDAQGLRNAGLWIGRLERILIITAILVDQFALIGFLVAAKSILRFADIQTNKNRQEAEYVLVGTLFSFTAAIAVGLITKATLTYAAALLAP